MIPSAFSVIESGHLALWLAFCTACAGVILSLCFPQRAISAPVLRVNLFLVASSFAILMFAFVTSDFSVALAVGHSHSAKPLLYKISGVWGNHEGSLLLWILVLCGYGAALTWQRRLDPRLKNGACFVQNGLIALFLGLSLFTSNPFRRVFPPAPEGNDLNPLLQDPALTFHPPLLYLGYVGYSLVFALAVSGLWQRRIDAAWAKTLRPWALVAWMFLSAGLVLGSWWAYYELGWGGWWFWDPVENAALLPWLTGTALFHSLIVLEKRRHLPNWTVLLAILCFSLSLLGTFLVRSGVITSVHAFASDPTRGLFILMMLGVVLGGALGLYAVRRPHILNDTPMELFSRETALVLNNLFLISAMVTVLIGTLYPYVLQTLTGTLISVGPPYYALTFVPLMLPLLALMAIGPFTVWGGVPVRSLWKRVRLFALLTLFVVAFVLNWRHEIGVWPLLCLTSGVWVVAASLAYLWERAQGRITQIMRQPAAVYAVTLGHMGLGIAVLGMTGGAFWTQTRSEWLRTDDSLTIGAYRATLQSVTAGIGDNYNTDTAQLDVTRDGKDVTQLAPQKRWYPVAEKDTTEVAIHPLGPLGTGDIYAALGSEDEKEPGRWQVTLHLHPMINLLWTGAAVMIAGGLCALFSNLSRRKGRTT